VREEVGGTAISLLATERVAIQVGVLSVVASASVRLAALGIGVGFGLDVFIQAIVFG
jgi:hypothetical protein